MASSLETGSVTHALWPCTARWRPIPRSCRCTLPTPPPQASTPRLPEPSNCYEPAQPDMTRDHYSLTSTRGFIRQSTCNLHAPTGRTQHIHGIRHSGNSCPNTLTQWTTTTCSQKCPPATGKVCSVVADLYSTDTAYDRWNGYASGMYPDGHGWLEAAPVTTAVKQVATCSWMISHVASMLKETS